MTGGCGCLGLTVIDVAGGMQKQCVQISFVTFLAIARMICEDPKAESAGAVLRASNPRLTNAALRLISYCQKYVASPTLACCICGCDYSPLSFSINQEWNQINRKKKDKAPNLTKKPRFCFKWILPKYWQNLRLMRGWCAVVRLSQDPTEPSHAPLLRKLSAVKRLAHTCNKTQHYVISH